MKASKFIKGTGVAAAAMLLPMSQSVMAESTYGISGWINESIIWFDDGEDTGVGQVSDNGTTLGSRVILNGTYMPEGTGISAGFEFIMELQDDETPLLSLNQSDLDSSNGGFLSGVNLLSHNIHIGGDWGKVTVGQQSMPTDNIAVLADVSGTIFSGISPVFRFNNFDIRGTVSGDTWGDFATCASSGLPIGIDCNGIYRNGVRYDAPAFGGFSVAAGWANDDIYDVALKYAGEFGDFKTSAGVGYTYDANGGAGVGGGDGSDLIQGEVGIMHVPTGLFVVGAYSTEDVDGASSSFDDSPDAYYFKGGIRKAFTSLGDSAFYMEYAQYNDQYGGAQTKVGAGDIVLSSGSISGSEFSRWSIAAEQYIGARLGLYGKYEEYELDVSGTSDFDGADDLEVFTFGMVYFF